MFGFLKKKIDSFAEKVKSKLEKKEELVLREEGKPAEETKKELIELIKEEKETELKEELKKEKIPVAEEELELEEGLTEEEKEVLAEIKEKERQEELEKDAGKKKERKEAVKEFEEKKERQIKEKAEKEALTEKAEPVFEEEFEEEIEKELEEKKTGREVQEKQEEETEERTGKPELEKTWAQKKAETDLLKERELKAKVSLTSGIKKFFTGKIKIEEKDVKDFLEEFELALLESDVEQQTAEKIVKEIKKELIGKEISGKNISEELKKEIALILERIMDAPQINLKEKMSSKKPFVILFLGPNGAGKTTSIAKIAFKFKKQGTTVILAAADTFRAASIEQIEKHSERIGVRLVKHQYGSDPAAVAFDAVKAAEAKNIDLVLIDSAGRQDTNMNLMNELKKIDKVVKPDLKIFVGEAMAGNSLFLQAKEFNEKIGFDGFILTKIDTDAKGGTAISLVSELKKPVIFVGTGQGYEDLIEFTPKFITDRIIK
ncbi:MAG: signal recognition particle-docking protein FtsY [archaeon]